MKFVYCGFDFFEACLRECIGAGHQLIAAFSQPVDGVYNSNTSVETICKQQGIQLQVRKVTVADINSFQIAGCNFLLAAAYQYRIPAKALVDAGIKGMNIHPSLLPEGRGPWPLPHVILKECEKSGVTIHKLAENFDAGEILVQSSFPICSNENLETLSCKVQMAASKLVEPALHGLDEYWIRGIIQQEGSYWTMPVESDRILDWNKPISEIDKVVRAFGKFESYANFDGQDWLVQDVTVWKEVHTLNPGMVVHRTNREVVVAASDGFVCLRQFRAEQKLK